MKDKTAKHKDFKPYSRGGSTGKAALKRSNYYTKEYTYSVDKTWEKLKESMSKVHLVQEEKINENKKPDLPATLVDDVTDAVSLLGRPPPENLTLEKEVEKVTVNLCKLGKAGPKGFCAGSGGGINRCGTPGQSAKDLTLVKEVEDVTEKLCNLGQVSSPGVRQGFGEINLLQLPLIIVAMNRSK